LFESAAILDHLDELVGRERALLPASGADRRQALNLMAMATGAAEKGVQQLYERVFRPEEKRHQPWVDRLRLQMTGSLAAIDRYLGQRRSQWLVGGRLSQADVTAVCAFTFLNDALRVSSDAAMLQSLGALAARCEAMPAFTETRELFSAPSG
jgi:glutathione S-transferase